MKTVTRTKSIPLMESFYTVQGEGFHQGVAAHFVRLGGCDVGCHWCDVKESWTAADHSKYEVDEICRTIDHKAEIVVLTGGEPLMYDLTDLTQSIKEHGYKVHLETSGAYPLTGYWDWVCLSPKKFVKPTGDIYSRADELKVIIYNKSDFDWALSEAEKVGKECKLYLQPEWSKANKMIPQIVDFVKRDTRWSISLQIHKYLNIP